MTKTKYLIVIIFLILTFNSFGQNTCGISIDTTKILLDENLDNFLSAFKSETFKTFTDKNQLPKFIKQQLDCLTKDNFSMSNPNEDYWCCCTSSKKLPKRKLLFFSTSKDVLLMTYLTGGIGVSTTILMLRFKAEKIVDVWTGYGFPKFKSKEEVLKHIKTKRKNDFGLHSNYISIQTRQEEEYAAYMGFVQAGLTVMGWAFVILFGFSYIFGLTFSNFPACHKALNRKQQPLMAAFNIFKKKDNINWVTLPQPDDSISFFETVKTESEKFWADTFPDKGVYGFQIQQDTKWRQGLNDTELLEFEKYLGFPLPTPLRNFYKTMNGVSKPGINLYGNDGTPPVFRSVFYSYPDDKHLIKELIDWIYEATAIKEEDLESLEVSKIFPVYGHRFMLIDLPGNPILSMYGDDIIYYAENLSKLLANEIFSGVIYNVSDFESPPQLQPNVKFWVD